MNILLEVKDNKADFVMELLRNLSFVKAKTISPAKALLIEEIKEAVATYVSRAAEKLRKQNSAATIINVFVIAKAPTKLNERYRHGPSIGSYTMLDVPTSATNELIKPALKLIDRFFEKGKTYKKAGVILSGLVPDSTIQGNLFVPEKHNGKRLLMNMIDNINFSNRDDVIKFASSGTKRNWKMRAELRSPRYTNYAWCRSMQILLHHLYC